MERLTKKQNIVKQTSASIEEIKYVVKEDKFGKAINKLGELEDVLEKWHIENLEGYICALIEARNIAIDEKKTQFKKYIEEVAKRENLEQKLAEIKGE